MTEQKDSACCLMFLSWLQIKWEYFYRVYVVIQLKFNNQISFSRCWDKEPDKRPSFSRIVPYLQHLMQVCHGCWIYWSTVWRVSVNRRTLSRVNCSNWKYSLVNFRCKESGRHYSLWRSYTIFKYGTSCDPNVGQN